MGPTPGAGLGGQADAGQNSFSAPGAESFRSNWQAQMASLGKSADTALGELGSRELAGAQFTGAEKAANSSGKDSAIADGRPKTGKSENEKAAPSGRFHAAAGALPPESAVPAAATPAFNPAEIRPTLASARIGSGKAEAGGGELPLEASGGFGRLGTVAELRAVPSWGKAGSGLPHEIGDAELIRAGETGPTPADGRVDSDAGPMHGAGEASPADFAPHAGSDSPPERAGNPPLLSEAAGQSSGSSAGAGMQAGFAENAQSSPPPGPIPDLLPGSETGPAKSPPAAALARVNAAATAGTRSGLRGAAGGAAHGAGDQAQASGIADGAGWVRDPGLTLPPQTGAAGRNAADSAESALREPFSALDAEGAPGAFGWTHAGARQAEAGFQDPALGWVGVRAELSGGGVHAALVPGSVDAAEQLGRQMDGLHTYLAEQRTTVDSLVMAAPERGGTGSGSGGFGSGTQQGMGQGTEQGAGQNAGERTAREPDFIRAPVLAVAGSASHEPAAAISGPDVSGRMGGGLHISLVA